ncbi:hypothetical protein [Halalkalibacter oceani]|uniref:hypothetical protein n=1 Tax=Halalkalibacter oceani TaxID=1653776 RepID=UPI00339B8A4B
MAKVKKGNRILDIDSGRVDAYLKQGYDQINASGAIIKHATGGKAVPVGEYNKLREELEDLKGSDAAAEIAELKAEIKKLKTENTKLKKELDTKEEPKE